MKTRILREAVDLLDAVLDKLIETATRASSDAAAELRRQCGAVMAQAPALIRTNALGAPLWACYKAALAAGATADALTRLRVSIDELAAAGEPAIALKCAASRFAIIAECKALAAMTFRSKSEVDVYRTRITAAFDAAIDLAADRGEHEAMRALISLHAAATADLIARGRPLPRMIDYSFARPFPSLVVAQRIYGDASREPELVAENNPAHPLFMPAAGRAYSKAS